MTKKVFVADDSSTIRKLFQMVLKKFNCEYKIASDGEDALKKLESFRPDIFFLDANMPGKTGWEILEEIKKTFPDSYTILMTADDDEQSDINPDLLIKKPFSIQDLTMILSRILEIR